LAPTDRRRQLKVLCCLFTLCISTAVANPVAAQYLGGNGVHIDLAVQENAADGRLSFHGFDFDVLPQFGLIADKRAFIRGVSIQGNTLIAQDPGFNSRLSPDELSHVGLLAPRGGEDLIFNILSPPISTMPALGGRSINYWDGTGSVSWGAVPDDEGIRLLNGSVLNPTGDMTISGASNSDVDGFTIASTTSGGSIHHHIKWILLPDNGALPPVGPDDGVYLMLYEFSLPSYAEWIPVFIGIEAFSGGVTTRTAALNAIEADFQKPLCDDGIDNDKDGTIDAAGDAGCADDADMSERGATTECDNGIDDDGDGFADFHDLDGDGASDYGGDGSCLHPTNALEIVPEPGSSIALAIGTAGLAATARRGRERRRAC